MVDGTISKIQLPDNTIYDVVDNTSGYMTGMTILSYGSSTWQNFIDAYSSNKVVYCRASSNANPASGSQTRLAFMAYVNNATTPTNVEFQYYRSVSTHTASQQGDQVFVYKLDKTAGWSVTTREASVKVVAGTGLEGTYSNGTMTLTGPTKVSDLTNDSGFITGYTETDPIFTASAAHGITSSDITNWNGKQAALVSGTNIKTINNTTLLGSGNIDIQSAAQNVWYGTCPTTATTNTKVVTTTSGDFAGNIGDVLIVAFDEGLAYADSIDLVVDGIEYSLDGVSPTFNQESEYGALTTVTFVVTDDAYVFMIDNYIGLYAEYLENEKQDTLVSGTNIKTINGDSILGSGNLTVTGGTQVQLVRWS